jgi:hypothetical protein
MLSYCESDVRLLLEECLSFRKEIMNFTKSINNNKQAVDPFRVAVTLASILKHSYRSKLNQKLLN